MVRSVEGLAWAGLGVDGRLKLGVEGLDRVCLVGDELPKASVVRGSGDGVEDGDSSGGVGRRDSGEASGW